MTQAGAYANKESLKSFQTSVTPANINKGVRNDQGWQSCLLIEWFLHCVYVSTVQADVSSSRLHNLYVFRLELYILDLDNERTKLKEREATVTVR